MVLAFKEYKIYWGAHPFSYVEFPVSALFLLFNCWPVNSNSALPALIKEDNPSLTLSPFSIITLGAKILCLCLHFEQNTRSNVPNHDIVVHADAVLVVLFSWVSKWTKANVLDPKFALVPFIWVLESKSGVFHGDRLASWCTLWCKCMVSNMSCLVGRIFFAKFWDPDLETHTSPTLHTSHGNS